MCRYTLLSTLIYVTVYAKRGDKSEKNFTILLWLSQLYGFVHIYTKFCAGRLYTFQVTPIFIRGYRKIVSHCRGKQERSFTLYLHSYVLLCLKYLISRKTHFPRFCREVPFWPLSRNLIYRLIPPFRVHGHIYIIYHVY